MRLLFTQKCLRGSRRLAGLILPPVCLVLLLLAQSASAGVVRSALGDRAYAVLQNGRLLALECNPPSGIGAKAYLQKFLADPAAWVNYVGSRPVVLAYDKLKLELQREVLLAVFPDDMVDDRGWWHQVGPEATEGEQNLWSLCEWLTGRGTNYRTVLDRNRIATSSLQSGEMVLIPRELLKPSLRKPTPERIESEENGKGDIAATAVNLEEARGELRYETDAQGGYAAYRLKPGEALYTAVVVRFTDIGDNQSILEACDLIQRRSDIADVHSMPAGTLVRIPIDMLSDRFRPGSSAERQEYEDVLQEAQRLRGEVRSKDLEGVVVVLDPGHGGDDIGAESKVNRVQEDEINYDLACRIKQLLESTTRAKVYMTMIDDSRGYEPVNSTTLENGSQEYVLTTPRYRNADTKVSLALRWHLANAIHRRETARGVDPRKMVFTSIHCDALFNEKLRGAMIYIPGAKLRRDEEGAAAAQRLSMYKEVKEQPTATSTPQERRHDEAVSRNFAEAVLKTLAAQEIKVHDVGDPIRSTIRQRGGVEYVPAVLRNTQIPTKVLIEAANLTNPTDASRVTSPRWRQRFAQAYVDALRTYFGP